MAFWGMSAGYRAFSGSPQAPSIDHPVCFCTIHRADDDLPFLTFLNRCGYVGALCPVRLQTLQARCFMMSTGVPSISKAELAARLSRKSFLIASRIAANS